MKHFQYMLLLTLFASPCLQAMDRDPDYTDANDPNMEKKLRDLKGVPASPTLAAMAHGGYFPQPPSRNSKKECPQPETLRGRRPSGSPVSLAEFLLPALQLDQEKPLPTQSSGSKQ